MILGTIQTGSRYRTVHPGFSQAFDFLEQCFKCGVEPGRYEMDGDNVYALVMQYTPAEKETPRFETHDRYIDIQCMLRGSEYQWYLPRSELRDATQYNEEKDFTLYSFSGEGSRLMLNPGDFAVYFPEDGHLPGMMAGSEDCVRIVVKIKC
jgi:YhcH/YjgK/YiaL family protein